MGGGRLLGVGLLGGAGLVAALMLAWLAVSGASSGGTVLGLLLLVVLAGPLAVGGWYVLVRQRDDALAAALVESQREIGDADRVFRTDVAATLRSLADGAGEHRERVLQLARDVAQPPARDSSGFTSVPLDASRRDVLRRYDDLVWQRVRRLRDAQSPAEVAGLLHEIQQALDQRTDLLLRGREAPALSPPELLRSGARPATADSLAALTVGWAISRDRDDFLVEGLAAYFADGRTWQLAHLVPTSGGTAPAWLYIGPAANQLALLAETAPPAADGQDLDVDGQALPLVESGTAVVDVRGGAGTARGVLVSYRRYAAGRALALVEDWPAAVPRAYAGQTLGPLDLEVWPAQTAST